MKRRQHLQLLCCGLGLIALATLGERINKASQMTDHRAEIMERVVEPCYTYVVASEPLLKRPEVLRQLKLAFIKSAHKEKVEDLIGAILAEVEGENREQRKKVYESYLAACAVEAKAAERNPGKAKKKGTWIN